MQDFPKVVVIGASTGGLDALRVFLSGLTRDFSSAIVICQHIDRTARLDYRVIYSNVPHLQLVEVEDKQPIVPGTVFFAPPGYHLYIESAGYFSLSVDAPVNWSRPSIDVLFESAARAYGKNVIGVILTGANGDGSRGVVEIKRVGGTVIAQDPQSALAPKMPQNAIETGCVDYILDLSKIAPLVSRLVGTKDNSSHIGAL